MREARPDPGAPIAVSGVRIHPVKSLRGYSVEEAVVELRGFRGDRRFMVVTPDGDFVSQRECHAMARITAHLDNGKVTLRAGPDAEIVVPAKVKGRERIPVRVWDSVVMADLSSPRINRWLSQALGRDVRLVFMPESTHRSVDSLYDTGGDIVSFADGYPYMAVGDASLAALNGRMEAPLPMERFRPNMTFSGSTAFAEDGWGRIRVGPVEFQIVKPCARCVVTTIDPDLGTAGHEPLATLAEFRKREGKVYMGVNLVPNGVPAEAVIRVGDPVVVLEPGRDGDAAGERLAGSGGGS